jgi:CcmD family protein
MAIFALAAQTPPSPATTTGDPGNRSTTFRPVEGGNTLQSGERLLVEAYAAIWFIVFAFVLLSWRRQLKLDRRIADLEAALRARRGEAARREPDA